MSGEVAPEMHARRSVPSPAPAATAHRRRGLAEALAVGLGCENPPPGTRRADLRVGGRRPWWRRRHG